MSDALSAVSQSGFKKPNTPQREQDLAIAVYYAQLAWNAANGTPIDEESIRQVRQSMGIPEKLPSSFQVRDANVLLSMMVRYKQLHFATDHRIILACYMDDGRLKVQWRDGAAA